MGLQHFLLKCSMVASGRDVGGGSTRSFSYFALPMPFVEVFRHPSAYSLAQLFKPLTRSGFDGFVCFIYCNKLLNLPLFIFILTGNGNEYKLYPELSSYREKTGK